MPAKWQTRLFVFRGLHHKPQTRLIAKRLGLRVNEVVGALFQVWFKFQEDAIDQGRIAGKKAAWLDVVAEVDGFAEAMAVAGWLTIDEDGLGVTHFDEFISKSAVRRQEDTIRKARSKDGGAGCKEGSADILRTYSGHAPEKVPDVPPTPIVPTKKKRVKPEPDLLFDRFWEAYPESHRQARPRALAEWRKLKVTDEVFDKVMGGLKVWVDSSNWREDHGRWVPFPANFLKGRRWEDRPGAGSGGGVQPLGRVQSPPGKYANLKRHIVADATRPVEPDTDPRPRQQTVTLFPDEDP